MCSHDKRFGEVFGLPPGCGGCLACYAEVLKKESIPEMWIMEYVTKLLSVAKELDENSVMRQSVALRASHAMDLVEAFRESKANGSTTD